MSAATYKPEVTRYGMLDMQVCVPEAWTDAEVVQFASTAYPCGTEAGWQIRTDEKYLAGCPVRNPCQQRIGMVHVMLDA